MNVKLGDWAFILRGQNAGHVVEVQSARPQGRWVIWCPRSALQGFNPVKQKNSTGNSGVIDDRYLWPIVRPLQQEKA